MDLVSADTMINSRHLRFRKPKFIDMVPGFDPYAAEFLLNLY
jgi:hypothetical protein